MHTVSSRKLLLGNWVKVICILVTFCRTYINVWKDVSFFGECLIIRFKLLTVRWLMMNFLTFFPLAGNDRQEAGKWGERHWLKNALQSQQKLQRPLKISLSRENGANITPEIVLRCKATLSRSPLLASCKCAGPWKWLRLVGEDRRGCLQPQPWWQEGRRLGCCGGEASIRKPEKLIATWVCCSTQNRVFLW